MPEPYADLLTRLDKLRTYLRNHRDSLKVMGDPILRREGERIIDLHLDTLDDASERLQVN